MRDSTRAILALLIVLIVLIISNKASDPNKGTNIPDEDAPVLSDIQYSAVMTDPDLDWGLTLTVKDATRTGLTLVCEQSGGNATGELHTGSPFALEALEDGKWIQVPYLPMEGDLAWTQEAWMIPAGETVEWEVNWPGIYGEIPAGNYRISKEITDHRAPGDNDHNTYFAYFTVE